MTYPKPTIIAAVNAARVSTNWREASLVIDTAAHMLTESFGGTFADAAQQVRQAIGLDHEAQMAVERS